MRILLVSDLHYALRQLDWTVANSPHFDLVVVAGDSLDIASALSVEAQMVVVLEYLSMLSSGTRVVVSSGNHDLVGPDANGEQAALWLGQARASGIATDGDSIEIDDTLVTVCPWWDGPHGRRAVEEQLEADASRRPGRWIWVYHWPPLGSSTCWTGKRDYGDEDLAGWIPRFMPDIVLSGHVHQSPFVEKGSWVDLVGRTWVFNAGNQRGPVPTRIEIDLDAESATWTSLMDTQAVDLTGSSGSRT
jgi:Icc-related predicted phosphoesterase